MEFGDSSGFCHNEDVPSLSAPTASEAVVGKLWPAGWQPVLLNNVVLGQSPIPFAYIVSVVELQHQSRLVMIKQHCLEISNIYSLAL